MWKGKYYAQTPHKIHAWDGISKRGATYCIVFSGTMNTTMYGDILPSFRLPFVRNTYPDVHRLYQEMILNTLVHTYSFLLQNSINWWNSLAKTPDVTPTEKVGAQRGHAFMTNTSQEASKGEGRHQSLLEQTNS